MCVKKTITVGFLSIVSSTFVIALGSVLSELVKGFPAA